MGLESLLKYLPEVRKPAARPPFKERLKWTLIILVAYSVLSIIPLYGLGQNALAQFQNLFVLLGASIGSILTLGIGPIVTASIVLQVLVGSGIISLDLTKPEGRKKYEAMQKLAVIFFIVLEGAVYVIAGGLKPDPSLAGGARVLAEFLIICQLILGGYLVVLMDEVISKWGFSSGISLFIALGVATDIFVGAFSPLNQQGSLSLSEASPPIGRVWSLVFSIMAANIDSIIRALLPLIFTVVVFVIAVYAQAMKVEIPLSFGRVRGYGFKWPLNFIYTSNIPVILMATLIANFQLLVRLIGAKATWLLSVEPFINPVNLVDAIINRNVNFITISQILIYVLLMMGGALLFGIMWVKTNATMSSEGVAKQILSSGLQIPGFRRDPRVLETILNRYIPSLTVMGSLFVGFIAAFADITGALGRGTGILLTVMIVYKLYEEIARQHATDMNPMLKRFIAPE